MKMVEALEFACEGPSTRKARRSWARSSISMTTGSGTKLVSSSKKLSVRSAEQYSQQNHTIETAGTGFPLFFPELSKILPDLS
jgi:hypothetical protein